MTIEKEQRAIYLDACPIFGRENGDVSGDIGFEAGSEECTSCSKTTPKMCSACMEDCGVKVKIETVKSERKTQEPAEEINKPNGDTPPESEIEQTKETVETPATDEAAVESNDQTENVVVDSPEADSSLDSVSVSVAKAIEWEGEGSYALNDQKVLIKTDNLEVGAFNLSEIPEHLRETEQPKPVEKKKKKDKPKVAKKTKGSMINEYARIIRLAKDQTADEMVEVIRQNFPEKEAVAQRFTLSKHLRFSVQLGVLEQEDDKYTWIGN